MLTIFRDYQKYTSDRSGNNKSHEFSVTTLSLTPFPQPITCTNTGVVLPSYTSFLMLFQLLWFLRNTATGVFLKHFSKYSCPVPVSLHAFNIL